MRNRSKHDREYIGYRTVLIIDTGLKGKTVIVTGANHGIGAATAIAFAWEGARVLINFLRHPAPDKQMRKLMKDTCHFYTDLA